VLSGCLPVGTCLLDWLRESQKIEFLEWVQCDCVDADTPAKMGHVVLQLPSMASSGIVYSTTVCYDPPANSPSDAEPSAESQPLRLTLIELSQREIQEPRRNPKHQPQRRRPPKTRPELLADPYKYSL
ncbi:unnamed protein product, partial [Polarella glacialis]